MQSNDTSVSQALMCIRWRLVDRIKTCSRLSWLFQIVSHRRGHRTGTEPLLLSTISLTQTFTATNQPARQALRDVAIEGFHDFAGDAETRPKISSQRSSFLDIVHGSKDSEAHSATRLDTWPSDGFFASCKEPSSPITLSRC